MAPDEIAEMLKAHLIFAAIHGGSNTRNSERGHGHQLTETLTVLQYSRYELRCPQCDRDNRQCRGFAPP